MLGRDAARKAARRYEAGRFVRLVAKQVCTAARSADARGAADVLVDARSDAHGAADVLVDARSDANGAADVLVDARSDARCAADVLVDTGSARDDRSDGAYADLLAHFGATCGAYDAVVLPDSAMARQHSIGHALPFRFSLFPCFPFHFFFLFSFHFHARLFSRSFQAKAAAGWRRGTCSCTWHFLCRSAPRAEKRPRLRTCRRKGVVS